MSLSQSSSLAAFTLYARFPTVLREPLRASVTFWEATAPVKLPAWHCSPPGLRRGVRNAIHQGWYLKVGSTPAAAGASKPPTYPERNAPHSNTRLQKRFTGASLRAKGTRHLHRDCNFTEPLVETAPKSLRHSCRSELTRQGISLSLTVNPALRLAADSTSSCARVPSLHVAMQMGPSHDPVSRISGVWSLRILISCDRSFCRFIVWAISAISTRLSRVRWHPLSTIQTICANFSKFARFDVRSGCRSKNGMTVPSR